jgi:hypothetical protein
VGAQSGAADFLKKPGRAQNQVIFGQGQGEVFSAEFAVGSKVKMQGVVPIDQHEHRLKQVVAVWPASHDVQK